MNAWRALGRNCDRSLRRGDPVVVHGKLSAHVWTNKAGLEVTTFEVGGGRSWATTSTAAPARSQRRQRRGEQPASARRAFPIAAPAMDDTGAAEQPARAA